MHLPSGLNHRGLNMICIPITQGRHVVIDEADYELVAPHKWYSHKSGKNFYATTFICGKNVYMHRLILGITDANLVADHIDGNGLNNTRSNLRQCTKTQNMHNAKGKSNSKTGLKGVCYHARDNLFNARIRIDGKRKSLGYFKTAEDAHAAYCAAAAKYHGEFLKTGL